MAKKVSYMNMLKLLRNRKGVTLLEVIIYIALLVIIIPSISIFIAYGFDSYKSDYNLIQQQDAVTNAISMLRKDIELSKSYKVIGTNELELGFLNPANISSDKIKTWKLINNTLSVTNGATTTVIVEGIDTSKSIFRNDDTKKTIALEIQPIETNSKKYRNKNFLKPIITEFSVIYKNKK